MSILSPSLIVGDFCLPFGAAVFALLSFRATFFKVMLPNALAQGAAQVVVGPSRLLGVSLGVGFGLMLGCLHVGFEDAMPIATSAGVAQPGRSSWLIVTAGWAFVGGFVGLLLP